MPGGIEHSSNPFAELAELADQEQFGPYYVGAFLQHTIGLVPGALPGGSAMLSEAVSMLPQFEDVIMDQLSRQAGVMPDEFTATVQQLLPVMREELPDLFPTQAAFTEAAANAAGLAFTKMLMGPDQTH